MSTRTARKSATAAARRPARSASSRIIITLDWGTAGIVDVPMDRSVWEAFSRAHGGDHHAMGKTIGRRIHEEYLLKFPQG